MVSSALSQVRYSNFFPFFVKSCLPLRLCAMSLQENVPSGSGSADVTPKFDMHVYTSVMTEKDVRDAARLYGIPADLNPRLPPPDMTMDRLPRVPLVFMKHI